MSTSGALFCCFSLLLYENGAVNVAPHLCHSLHYFTSKLALQFQERAKKRKAEGKAAAAEAAARQAYGGGAGPDPLMGGRFDENREPCSSPGDAGQTPVQPQRQLFRFCALASCALACSLPACSLPAWPCTEHGQTLEQAPFMYWTAEHCGDETMAWLCLSVTLSPDGMHSRTYTAEYTYCTASTCMSCR